MSLSAEDIAGGTGTCGRRGLARSRRAVEGTGSTSAAAATLPGTRLQAAAGCRAVGASALVERERGGDHRSPAACGGCHPPPTARATRTAPSHLTARGSCQGVHTAARGPCCPTWRPRSWARAGHAPLAVTPGAAPPTPPPSRPCGLLQGGGSPPHLRWSPETARYKREAGVSGVKGPVTGVGSPPLRVADPTRVRPAVHPLPRVAHGVPTPHMHLRQRWSPAPPD